MKLCDCGCGQPAPLACQTNKRRGWVKGQPIRFISGHHRRKSFETYSFAIENGERDYLHRVRAERALGKPLPPGAEVHHADGTKRDDAPLVICQDRSYHQLLHRRMRIVKAGGNPNTDKVCRGGCRRILGPSAFQADASQPDGLQMCCRECRRKKRLDRIARTA
jgi:hypothetical protein